MSETTEQKIARLEREMEKSREDLRIMTSKFHEAIDNHREEQERTKELHHIEKMELMRQIGNRIDSVIDAAEDTMVAIQNLDDKLTVAPSNQLEHGYAILVQPIPMQNDSYTIRFIAGQRQYVDKQLESLRGDVWRHFDATGNPIDLRQRFKKAANEVLNRKLARVSF